MIRIQSFGGEAPRASPDLLKENQAVTALNCDLRSGALMPYAGLLKVGATTKTGTVNSLYRFAGKTRDDATGAITNVTNATPIQITSANHGLSTGDRVTIFDTGIAAIDGKTYSITLVNSSAFTLDGTTAPGSTSSTGTWALQNGYWFHWTTTEAANGVDVARGAVIDDTDERTYFTGQGVPKMTYSPLAITGGPDWPAASYDLGVPAPTQAPSVAVSGVGTGNPTEHAWVYTYVSAKGEEGPPSPPSTVLSVEDGQSVDLSSMQTGPTGSYNITAKRIYRSQTGASGQRYYYVAEIAISSTTYTDTMGSFQGAIQTTDWDPPPSDLAGIVALPNGITAGYSKNRLWLSELAQPHAWPYFTEPTESPIVGIATDGSSVVICTQTRPYLATGTDPSAFTMKRLEQEQACVSKESIVYLPEYGVCYASPDGLILVGGGKARNIIEPWMTRKEWQALKPSTIKGYRWDGRYVGFYDNGTPGAFLFDPDESGAGLTFTDAINPTAGLSDHYGDGLYLVSGSTIYRWGSGSTPLSYTWKSRVFYSPRGTCMQAAQILFGSSVTGASTLTFKLYGDGTLRHTQTFSSASDINFRLPGGYKAREWQIELAGNFTVRQVTVAETMSDLGYLR